MKKIMLTIAAAAFIGVAAMAQTTPSGTSTSTTTRGRDWSKVESSQVPAGLQQTLKDDKYKGWENSGVYYNKTTQQYSVDARGNGTSSNSYNFDSNGKAVTSSNASGSTSGTTPNSSTRPNGSSMPNSTPGGSAPSTPATPNP